MLNSKRIIITITFLCCIKSIVSGQTQFGESGLFYTPSSYAILPGVYEFGVLGHVQYNENYLEYPAPIYFSMGVAPRIESFVSYPDIFSIGKIDNLHQQYGNIGMKFRFANLTKRRIRMAVTVYTKYLANSSTKKADKYLPGCIVHLSRISTSGRILHVGLNCYREQARNFNLKLNLGYEFYFYKELLNFYADSYFSLKSIISDCNEWTGAILMMQLHPHFTTHLETGIGFEMIGKEPLIYLHLGFTFTSGHRIINRLRKKKEELPKPPPLENLLQQEPQSDSKNSENGD